LGNEKKEERKPNGQKCYGKKLMGKRAAEIINGYVRGPPYMLSFKLPSIKKRISSC
jgi:hypothetical protein